MGFSSHSVEKFGSPFLMADELVFVVPAASAVDLTRHHFKFLFLLNGEIAHEIEGLEGPGILREGDILAAPPVRFHRYINTAPRSEARIHMVRIFLDSGALHERPSPALIKPEFLFNDFVTHHFARPHHLVGGIHQDVRTVLAALRKETDLREPGFRHRVHSLCVDLVILAARQLSVHSRPRTSVHVKGIVATAQEFIQKHFADPNLRLGTIAFHAGKGDEHLARQFKRETGRSVFEFVRETRINHAKTLLLDPSMTFTAIAAECGFHSLAFFSRSFRQIVGCPPSAYRNRLELRLRSAPVPKKN